MYIGYNSNSSIKSVDNVTITPYRGTDITNEFIAQLPLFYINKHLIRIPRKVATTLTRYTPKHLLKAIHKDTDVAIELCLLFLTLLNSTYFELKEGGDGWKSLKAEYLRKFLALHPMTYKNVVAALEHPLEKGQILQCDHQCITGEKAFKYRLGDAYLGKGIVSYELKTKEGQNLLYKDTVRKLIKANQNPIYQNLLRFYPHLSLPTLEQIRTEAQRLIKLGYKTPKGKKLTFMNKHSKDYFKDADQRSFVETAIEIFQYLTVNGLMIPTIGDDKSGGRVVDSITLMPSWIRKLIKIDGEYATISDYSCLHPNIVIALYGGTHHYLTHRDLGLSLGIDVNIVKVEHLSFFNKKVCQMKKSPLYGYYDENEPSMLANIITEKYNSPYKHKATSRKLFKKECEIMTNVITELNREGIYVGYVYDALICHPVHANHIKEVMDNIILKHGVKTTAKLSVEVHYPSAA